MAKDIIFDIEARAGLKRGADKLANAVKVTLGVKGRNVVVGKGLGKLGITKDGVTVAKEVELLDPLENIGAQMVREVALRTDDLAGDGTTTATVLTQAILAEGFKNITAGANPLELKKGIDKAVEAIVKNLEKQSVKVKNNTILDIATVSANNDKEIGKLIVDAFKKVGKDGIITFEEASGRDTSISVVEGIKFDKGYLSPHFINDFDKREVSLENCFILLHDGKLEELSKEMGEVFNLISDEKASILIIADDFSEEILSLLVINKNRGILNVAAVKTPGFGDRRREALEDIEMKTGAIIVSKETGISFSGAVLGKAKKVNITDENTSIVEGQGDKELIKQFADSIRQKVKTVNGTEKTSLELRLSRLSGGTAVISVGAISEVEMLEKKDRVEDAIGATKSAVEEGVVAGGGIALLRAVKSLEDLKPETDDELTGINIILKAVEAPLRTILENAGLEASMIISKIKEREDNFGYNAKTDQYVDMMKAGIIDPKKVTRIALENAASVAGMIMTIGCVFIEINEQEKN